MKLTAQRILVFHSTVCAHCISMKKVKTIDKLVDKLFPPKIEQKWLNCMNEEGEAPEGTEFGTNFAISDGYKVAGFPTVIFEGRRADGKAIEIARGVLGETVEAFTVKEFERVYKRGLEALEELPDNMLTQDEAAAKIAW